MNRIYRIVFNRSLGLWQVVSEHARSCRGNGRAGPAGCSALLASTALALALAAGPALADGGGGSAHALTGQGGAGGADNPLGPGGAGGDAAPGSTQGGGGGGAGTTSGAGGQGDGGDGNGGAGGAHGAVLTGTLSDVVSATAGSGGGQGGFGYSGDGGGGGAGGYGVVMDAGGDLGTLAGSLTVRGGDGGAGGDSPNRYGGDGGSGGVGLYLAQPDASVTIAGTVSGGNGGKGGGGLGAGASGSGGNGGAGLVFAQPGGTAVITGTVQGGNGGAAYAGSPNGAGGAGIIGADLTVVNGGTISGGLSGDGATRADAIDFTGGVNTLELRAGSTITGNVLAYSSADTLRLGGDADAVFNVSQIGTQYSGFGVFEKTGASTWALSGATTQATPWMIQAGTLRAIASNVLGNDSAITVDAGATLDLNDNSQSIGSLAGAGGVTLGGNGATLLTTGGDNTSTTFSGVISGAGGLVKTGTGTFTLSGTNTYGGGTTITGGTLAVSADANLGAATGGLTLAGGTLQNTAAFASARDITLSSGTTGIFQTDADLTLSGTIGGAGGLAKHGAGTLTLTGTADYGSNSVSVSTSTWVDDGALVVDGGNLTSAKNIDVGTSNDAALVVENGGVIDTLGITGGRGDLSSSGRIIVTGPGSTLTTTSSLIGVNLLNGSLTLEDGGTVMTGSGTGVQLFRGSLLNFGSADLANPTTAGNYSGAAINGAAGGGIVNFNQTDSLSLAAPLTGALAVNQRGTGTTLLTGANSYTGGTTITAGTLAFAAADNLGSGAVTLDGGTLQWAAGNTADVSDRLNPLGESGATFDTHGNDVAFATGLSGAGGLVKQGAGTLTLTGANGYTGGTVIDAGTLQIGDGGTSGSILGDVADNGTLAFDRSDDISFGGGISGGGSVAKQGAGTLTLTGANSYAGGTTISGGTLAVSSDANLGAATGGLALAGGTLQNTAAFTSARDITLSSGTVGTFQTDADLTLSGTIGGAGGLVKHGAGTLTFTGTADYGSNSPSSNSTDVEGGTLVVDGGSLTNASEMRVATDADAAAALVVENGGAVSVLHITGGRGDLSSSGRIIVTGPGSSLTTTVNSTTSINLFNGSLTLENGGALVTNGAATSGVLLWGGDSTLNFGSADLANPTTAGSYSGAPITGQVATGGGIVNFNQTDSLSLAAPLTGALAVSQRGTGTTLLTGANSYTGGTTISGGTLAVSSDANLGAASGGLALAGGTLQNTAAFTSARDITLGSGTTSIFQTDADLTLSGTIGGAGGLAKTGAGTLTLTGAADYGSDSVSDSYSTYVADGVLVLDGGSLQDARGLQIGLGSEAAALVVKNGGTVSTNTIRPSPGQITVTGAGSSLTATTNGTNGAVLNGGSLTLEDGGAYVADNATYGVRLGNGGALNFGNADLANPTMAGSYSGAAIYGQSGGGIVNFNQTDSLSLAASLTGALAVNQRGTGTTLLTGANTYTGDTIVSAGALVLDGSSTGSGATVNGGAFIVGSDAAHASASFGGDVTVNTTGLLGGHGSIGGSVTVQDGGTLAPGNSPGTTTIAGDLTLNGGSLLQFELGNPAGTAGVDSDLVNVGGNLTLDGKLSVSALSGYGAGEYQLFSYGGTLVDHGLDFGVMPVAYDYQLDTATDHQVRLEVTAATAQYWDGANTTPSGVAQGAGGSGTWDAATGNWTNNTGSANSAWSGNLAAIFAGTPGVVTIADGYTASAPALSFLSDGYRLSATGGGKLELTGAATVEVLNAGTTATIDAPIAGTNGLTKSGAGTLVLTGANTYTGATTVAAGTLALSGLGSGALGTSSGVFVAAGGNLDISALTGSTTVAGINGLSGDGAVNLGGNALLVNEDGNDTFAGTIGGTGRLIKQDGGTLALTGASTYTGDTLVTAGTLVVDGSSASSGATVNGVLIVGSDAAHSSASFGGDVTVNATGLLGGHGSILGDVANNGIVAPGGSIGTLSVKGNYKQTGNAALNIEVSPTAASQLKVGGSASLSGTLNVTYDPGTYSPRSYTLVSASQGIMGAFDTVNHIGTANLGGLSPGLRYTDNTVDLSLTGSNASVVVAPTQTSIYTAMGTAAVLGAQAANAALLDRAGAAGGAAADANASGSAAWATLTGNVTKVAGRAAAPGFQAQRYGFLAGRDFSSDPDTAGIAFGYDHAALSEHDTGDTGTLDTVRAMLYGRREAGPVTLGATAGVGLAFLSQKRSFGQIGTAEGDHAGQEFTLGTQASLPLALGASTTLTPKLGLRYAWFHASGFGEHGAGGQNLKVGSDTVNSLQPYVGVALDQAFGDAAHPASAQLRVGYARELFDANRSLGVMSQDGTQFTAPGTSLPRGYLTAGVGVTLYAAKDLDVTFSYDTLFNTGGARAQQSSLNVSYRF